MQIIYHKSSVLTIPQKYFIERSIEILYRGTMDSYRVRVKSPRTIMLELKDSIEAFEKGKIKHFISIAAKEKGGYAIKDEALDALTITPNYLSFSTFSAKYFKKMLEQLAETNYKQVKDCLRLLLDENQDLELLPLIGH